MPSQSCDPAVALPALKLSRRGARAEQTKLRLVKKHHSHTVQSNWVLGGLQRASILLRIAFYPLPRVSYHCSGCLRTEFFVSTIACTWELALKVAGGKLLARAARRASSSSSWCLALVVVMVVAVVVTFLHSLLQLFVCLGCACALVAPLGALPRNLPTLKLCSTVRAPFRAWPLSDVRALSSSLRVV